MIKAFFIPFVGLKLGKHHFEYRIDNRFFKKFGYDQFEDILVKVDLILDKKPNLLELAFQHTGKLNVPCDRTGEFFDLPIKGNLNLVVRFGQEYNNEDENLLILPHGEYQLNVAQYIYEMIVLSVPIKRIKKENMDVLDHQKYTADKQPKVAGQKETDPRWAILKKLLNEDNNIKKQENGTS